MHELEALLDVAADKAGEAAAKEAATAKLLAEERQASEESAVAFRRAAVRRSLELRQLSRTEKLALATTWRQRL